MAKTIVRIVFKLFGKFMYPRPLLQKNVPIVIIKVAKAGFRNKRA